MTIDATINGSGNSANNSNVNAKPAKKQLTPEQKAILDQLVAGAFSSIAIHALGDTVANGIHKVADATQWATDKTAYSAGTAQLCAVPTAQLAWTKFTGLFSKNTAATPASL
jgi:small-conductance mechanosensitive channel